MCTFFLFSIPSTFLSFTIYVHYLFLHCVATRKAFSTMHTSYYSLRSWNCYVYWLQLVASLQLRIVPGSFLASVTTQWRRSWISGARKSNLRRDHSGILAAVRAAPSIVVAVNWSCLCRLQIELRDLAASVIMPLDTILLVDTSGSMAGRGIRELKRACHIFLDGVVETSQQTGLKVLHIV